MAKLVFGVGINDKKYPSRKHGEDIKEYLLWRSILSRCYSPVYQRGKPTYVGCSASDNFKSYSYFHEWCRTQIGFNQQNFQLDKDLIFKGNKLYSEDTCLFLPRELNALLVTSKKYRGSLPVGVTAHQRGNFLAQCSTSSTSRYAGVFKTPEEAFQAYKQAKEAFIKLQAEKWKAHIDLRAFAALMAYEVQITD